MPNYKNYHDFFNTQSEFEPFEIKKVSSIKSDGCLDGQDLMATKWGVLKRGSKVKASNAINDDFNKVVNLFLKQVGSCFNLDSCSLFFLNEDYAKAYSCNQWFAGQALSPKHRFKEVDIDSISWLLRQLGNGNCMFISSVGKLPIEASKDKIFFQSNFIKSVLYIPVLLNERLIGFVEFDSSVSQQFGSQQKVDAFWSFGLLLASYVSEYKIKEGLLIEQNLMEQVQKSNTDEVENLLEKMMDAFVLFESVFDENDNFISYRFLYINQAYEKITGVKLEDVRGKTIHEVWPGTEPEWVEHYGRVAMTGKSETFKLYHSPTQKLYYCNAYRPFDKKDEFCVIFEDVTEKEIADTKLRKVAAKYRGLFTKMHAGFALTLVLFDNKCNPTDLRFLEINHEFERIVGLKGSGVVGETIKKVFPEVESFWIDIFGKVAVSGKPVSFFKYSDKLKKHFQVSAYLTEPGIVASIITDITKLKNSQYQTELFKAVVGTCSIGNCLVQEDGSFYYVNDSACEILGYGREELLEMKITEIKTGFHEGDFKPYWELMKKKNSLHFQTNILQRGCREIPIEIVANHIEFNFKKLIIVYVSDISERKLIEEEIVKSHTRMKQVIDLVPEMIYAKDADGRFLLVNKAVAKAYNMSVKDLTGRSLAEVHKNKKQLDKMLSDDRKVIDSNRPLVDQERFFSISKEKDIWLETTKVPFVIADTSEPAVLGLSVDITQRKEDEERISKYQGRLRELLMETQKVEQEERKKFASIVHDGIGQNLVMTKFQLQQLIGKVEDDNIKKSLNDIASSFNMIIEQAQSLTFELSNTMLYKLGLETAIEQFIKENIQSRYPISCEFSSNIRDIYFNDELSLILFKAIKELLVNIIKHAEAKNIMVSLQEKEDKVEIVVEDNGVGMNGNLSKIGFLPSNKGGFGIFNIIQKIESLGGNILFENVIPSGTRVKLIVPFNMVKS